MKSRASKSQSLREASSDFFCSWGRHRVPKDYILKEQFPNGTMCYQCQWEITENLRGVLFMPEMTAALREQERKKHEIAKREKHMAKVWEQKLTDERVTGMVYYLRINGQVKIGYTKDLKQRSRTYPPGSELLAVEPAVPQTERDRHQEFSRWLVRGREWFAESPRLMAHIEALVVEYGLPDWLMHKFTEHDTR